MVMRFLVERYPLALALAAWIRLLSPSKRPFVILDSNHRSMPIPVVFDRLGRLDHRLQAAVGRPEIPLFSRTPPLFLSAGHKTPGN